MDNIFYFMSPYRSGTNANSAIVFDVIGSGNPGHLSNARVQNADGVVRPVISLKKVCS